MAAAQAGVAIVRDAETEALLQDYLRPIFKAARIPSGGVRTFLIPDDSFNAFVANGRQMFVNTGAIIGAETPGELIGVLAHETGHLAHNDQAKLRQALDDTKTAVMIASLIGMGAAIAGSLTNSQGAAAAGGGIVSGAATVGARSLLAYRRVQEAAADRAAVDYLNATGQSGAGMLATLKRLADQNLFASRQADPYLQSHPLPRERIIAVETLVHESKFFGKADPPALQQRHDLVRAKLIGFTWPSGRVATRYPLSDMSLPARYARAVSTYRFGALPAALKQIDGLIASDPSFPYFWELKGQALLETGSPQAALEPLRKAVNLAPDSALVKVLLGQALVATDNKALANEAVSLLSVAMQDDPDAAAGFRALARAYAMLGNAAMAQLTTAEGLFAEGNIKDAKVQATRAQADLKTGSPAWLRAADIVAYNPPKIR
jgi:predicted Zn-dependent protease